MNYTWEAEQKDGSVIEKGEDLSETVRFSFIPTSPPLLPKHDIIGVKMERRFLRTFHKIRFNDTIKLSDKLYWEDGNPFLKASTDLSEILKPGMLIRKKTLKDVWHCVISVDGESILLDRKYAGKTKWGITEYKKQTQTETKYHCVVCNDHRVYMNDMDGKILITPKEYELYI